MSTTTHSSITKAISRFRFSRCSSNNCPNTGFNELNSRIEIKMSRQRQFKEADAKKFEFKILIIQFLLWSELLEYSSRSKQKGLAQDYARWRSTKMTRQLNTNVSIYNLSFKPMEKNVRIRWNNIKWNIQILYIFLSKHISGLHTALKLLS